MTHFKGDYDLFFQQALHNGKNTKEEKARSKSETANPCTMKS